jgi:hypothetical protein
MGRDEIHGRLQTIFSRRSVKIMLIGDDKDRVDEDLDFIPIARSIDVAGSAGIDRVGLITPRVITSGVRANR